MADLGATPRTRSELLACRQQIVFARQGRDLIWDKRTALLREFAQLRLDLVSALARLAGEASAARLTLAVAEHEVGTDAVRRAALASAPLIGVELRQRRVAGVALLETVSTPVRRGPEARGWAPVLVEASVDAAADAYERYLEEVLRLCALELTVRRLAGEITRATRQVNALDNIVVPQLEAQARAITAALDEREREEHARLRRARAHRSTAAGEAA